MSSTILVQLPDVSCGHCQKAVIAALAQHFPGRQFTVDIPSQHLRGPVDPSEVPALLAVLKDIDYPGTVVSHEPE